jgi:phospholipase/carboxylesterase
MSVEEVGGLRTIITDLATGPATLVVLLHGYSMRPEDLAPFANSLGIPAVYLFPQGPEVAPADGYAWWAIDTAARASARVNGPRDLASQIPAGLSGARQRLEQFINASQDRFRPVRLIVGGFSQGGMLTCDWALHHPSSAQALLLLSASRLNMSAWQQHCAALAGLPVLVSHGRQDMDIAFAAGERLRDFVDQAGGCVTWVPFDGGHETPLHVWRSVREFLRALVM